VIAGGTAKDSLVPPLLPRWSERLQLAVERFGGECSDPEIERLTQVAKQQDCDVVVGMGGGKVIDTAKSVGCQIGARVGVVPTIASTDAPTSAVAVIYTPEGVFFRLEAA